jgi:hypothetical protein
MPTHTSLGPEMLVDEPHPMQSALVLRHILKFLPSDGVLAWALSCKHVHGCLTGLLSVALRTNVKHFMTPSTWEWALDAGAPVSRMTPR